jgi:uncharacterized protein (DUF2252 family)
VANESSGHEGRRIEGPATRPLGEPPVDGIARLTAVDPGGPDVLCAQGRSLRGTTPRTSLGVWEPTPDRRDPVEILEESNRTRLQDLVPVRYGRMLVSPFTYLRGSPAVMAADLATTPTTGIDVQACGDAHLLNFGLFGTPERHLVFDLNDFDETLPGPWEWDVKRLLTSVVVAGRTMGLVEADSERAALAGARSYRDAINRFALMNQLDIWYARVDVDDVINMLQGRRRKLVERTAERSRLHTSGQAFAKLTAMVDGRRRITDDPPVVEHLVGEGLEQVAAAAFHGYEASMPEDRRVLLSQYEFVDIARKVVGVGSVGTRCHIILLCGRVHGDPLFLQVKQAEASVLEPYVGASAHATSGERVVAGQRVTQAASDLLLGWTQIDDLHFYVRQLRDMKGSADLSKLDAVGLATYAALCAGTMARAHARTGSAPALSGYLGTGDVFDQAMTRFAVAYADQNELDHQRLVRAAADGRIPVLSGV